jgi:hypothetical protein
MKRTALALLALALAAAPASAAESANYINELYTFSNGGGHATSSNYIMDACIGQPAVGTTYDTVDPNKSSVSYYAPVFFGTDFHITLYPGYTLISLPISPNGVYDAETLGQLINAQTGSCTSVVRYTGGQYVTHPVGSTQNVFPIVVGEGYFVRCTAGSTLTFNGFAFSRSTAALTLQPGYSLVGLPLIANPAYDSETAAIEMNGVAQGGSVTQVIKYQGGQFVTHPVGSTQEIFTLELGKGYFIRASAGSTWTLSQ